MRQLQVYMLPALTTAEDLAGQTVVVIDVLRATTTIVHALAAGASEVIPCLEVTGARNVAASLGGDHVVLAGERGGLPIDGFALGNSPAEFRPETVGGKTIVFTTTNGTRAMQLCRDAREVLLGAFVNLSAVIAALRDADVVHLLCAGTRNKITREDVLLAGAIVDHLLAERPAELSDQAELALDAWRTVAHDLTNVPLAERLRASCGGRNMLKIGQESDIDLAAQIDRFDIVPRLDVGQWNIRPR